MKAKVDKIFLTLFLILPAVFAANAQSDQNRNKNQTETVNSKNAGDKCPESGVVRLRVVFEKTGKIGKIEIVSSGGCKDFDEQAIEAAKKIEFEPKKKNGKPVKSVRLIEYTFRIQE